MPNQHLHPRARMSVRTTFALSEEALEIKRSLTNRLDITQKELIDSICMHYLDERDQDLKALQALIKCGKEEIRIRKTQVVSQYALQELNKYAMMLSTDRDDILESLIRAYGEFVNQKLNTDYEVAEKIISECASCIEQSRKELYDLLGKYDPVVDRFGYVSVIIESLHTALCTEIAGGDPVDPDELS